MHSKPKYCKSALTNMEAQGCFIQRILSSDLKFYFLKKKKYFIKLNNPFSCFQKLTSEYYSKGHLWNAIIKVT